MNKVSDENESFAASDLILAQPTISDNLTLKKPAIGGDSLFNLEQPAISDNLMQSFLHHLTLPDSNHNNEDSR
ncbi:MULTISPECIES: hypothetical protein [unclassified Microcoleus]|uniref:hypothetical protein n=1 Tax=unclassified Microcoleus TaxID=2642155 RepID=UPI002FD40A93